MSDKRRETNPGVGCDVTNCKYNTIQDKRAEREGLHQGRDLLLDLLPQRHGKRLKCGRRARQHEAVMRVRAAGAAVPALHKCVLYMVHGHSAVLSIGRVDLYNIKTRLLFGLVCI